MEESSSLLIDVESRYLLTVIGKQKQIDLVVDEEDLIQNADGEIDCPVDVVLRKNGYTFKAFNDWDARRILFIRRKREEEEILRSIILNVNL